ncbi:hypothetical protein [Candidatus Poriferisodalis sp.]|uniref:hypothetical protein n=1 Tax=Candidatus Poriferisodalis sp. TaxID=3101277 RepID=UPI003C701482
MPRSKKPPMVLVTLTPDQIDRAKEANGRRKQITHALICGDYGQMFGTERQCLKYFTAWNSIFRPLFSRVHRTKKHDIENYTSTENLVIRLIKADDRRSRRG